MATTEHETADRWVERIAKAQADYEAKSTASADAMALRDRLIVDAVEHGLSTRRVARAAGCSQSRVMRILGRT